MTQSAHRVLMIEPTRFGRNPATAADNAFQSQAIQFAERETQEKALEEFGKLKAALEKTGIEVTLFKDVPKSDTPDSIYPNNWFSTHEGGVVIFYPLRAENRRKERREEVVGFLKEKYPQLIDLTSFEAEGKYLEGTGSLVLDRVRKVAYLCLSSRTNQSFAKHWAEQLGYKLMVFSAHDERRVAVYHTNVMMSIGTGYAVVCLEAISDQVERKAVKLSFLQAGIEVVPIGLDQLKQFCANVLELSPKEGKRVLAMSTRALANLRPKQLEALAPHVEIVHADISTIELCGGGGVRCMLAELF